MEQPDETNEQIENTNSNNNYFDNNENNSINQNQNIHENYSPRFLVPPHPHSTLTNFILNYSHSPKGTLSSVALNENDLSVDPIGLDLDLESSPIHSDSYHDLIGNRFRKTRFLLLDTFRAIILTLQTIYTANQFIGPFSNSNQPFKPYWNKPVYFPLTFLSQYQIHLLTLICSPALHFLLGASAVLAIHTRRSLGWRSHELFFRSLKLASCLLVLNQLLMAQTIYQTGGQVILTTLPIWSLGWNIIIITTILIGLFLSERAILNYLYAQTDGCLSRTTTIDATSPNQEEEEHQKEPEHEESDVRWIKLWADRIRVSIDAFLILGSGFLSLLIGYMLPGDRDGLDQDWWIEWSQTRSFWFWFFVSPTPEMSAHPKFKMVSNFAPIGWLPFVLLGAVYARRLIRKPRNKMRMFCRHLKLAMISATLFLMTRVLDIGNLAIPYIQSEEGREWEPIKPRLCRWLRGHGSSRWQMLLYTTSYPPDLAHLSLACSMIFFVLALLDLLPQAGLSFNPLLQFGRAPIFFYSVQLLSFHYILPSILIILDWPIHLNLYWISLVSLSSLPVLWLACEAWVVFKDRQSPESIWRFF